MRKTILAAAFLFLSGAAFAQVGPGPVPPGAAPPCSAFGTTAGTCLQGAGALGTPSSGVGTNITGVNAATLNGATFANPGAIGATPAAGNFTALAATGLSASGVGVQASGSFVELLFLSGEGYVQAVSRPSGSFFPLNINGTPIKLPQITTDATHTDSSVCQDTSTHGLYSGSGTLGICLGTSGLSAKTDVKPLPWFGAVWRLISSSPVSYHYKPGHGDNGARIQYGFVADWMTGAFPELVGRDAKGVPNSFDMFGMFAWLVRGFQILLLLNVILIFAVLWLALRRLLH